MPLVKVKPKYQVTIPNTIREQVGLEVGDLLEAEVQANRIVLTPKAVIDKGLKESLEEARQGKLIGPFRTAKATIRALKKPIR
ncbi:MAG: AbrB/MazE/SpoVT family DNA-binding domain-containing protein [candidate division NC10 bacterium]|nr:AbrB/MazE/SpoVT family DNA-binding domain-containing protein [candidate division NC10 bacterium]